MNIEEILTPCILQTVIICGTIVILGIVGVGAYRISKEQQRSWGSYIFSSSIFITIAIAIFSMCYCGDRNVLDFISLASAIISIILAVVTIVYSYFINSRSSGQIEQLNKAAQDVSKASQSYEESAESLQTNIQKILNEIRGIGAKIGVDSDYEDTVRSGAKAELAETIITDFCSNTSPAGCLLIYLCGKLAEKKQVCKLADIFAQDVILYYVGFSIALNSIGLATIIIDLDTHSIKSATISPLLLTGISKRLEREIEQKNQFVEENKSKIDTIFS